MKRFMVIIECIIEHQDKFLIIKRPPGVHAGGLLAFPGGKIERDDGAQDEDVLVNAVKREVLEEVGIELDVPVKYVTSSYFITDDRFEVISAVFYVRLESSDVVVRPSEREVPEYHWLTIDEIASREDFPAWGRRYLSAAMSVR